MAYPRRAFERFRSGFSVRVSNKDVAYLRSILGSKGFANNSSERKDLVATEAPPSNFVPDVESRNLSPELGLPPLPEATVNPGHGELASFIVVVLIPLLIVCSYYLFYASNQFVAEFRFTVTEVAPPIASVQGVTSHSASGSDSSALAGVASSMGLGGLGIGMRSATNNYLVIDYINSAQAVDDLQKKLNIRKMYSSRKYDWIARFNDELPSEEFAEYWTKMIHVAYDPITGLASVSVRAFEPRDAFAIAEALVSLSEQLVNRMRDRVSVNSINFAEREATKAQERLKRVKNELTTFRLAHGLIDPATSVTTNVDLAKNLRANILQLETEQAALQKHSVGGNAVAAKALAFRIDATKEQLRSQEQEMSKERESNAALVKVVGQFEQLDLERQFAQSMAVSTMQALDQARAVAAAQLLYLTPYVMPRLPESSSYPKRSQAILMSAVALTMLWGVGLMVIRSVREHF